MEAQLGENLGTRLETLDVVRRRAGEARRSPVKDRSNGSNGTRRSVTALGWLSVGLGVAGLVAPRAIALALGARRVSSACWILRALALRELTFGIRTLRGASRPGRGLARLPGDALGLVLLGGSLRGARFARSHLLTTAAAASIAAVDRVAAAKLQQPAGSDGHTKNFYVTSALTIQVPPERVYGFWRELPNLPRFLAHLESVAVVDSHTRFRVRLPAGIHVEWDAEITVDRPNESIQWRSLPESDVQNHGMVRFVPAPGGRGTEVHVMLSYQPPAGALGVAFAKLFGKLPAQQLRADLKRLKQILETGDLARSSASEHRGPHPAQPATERSGSSSGNGTGEVSK